MNGAQRAAALAALGKLEKRVEQLRWREKAAQNLATMTPARRWEITRRVMILEQDLVKVQAQELLRSRARQATPATSRVAAGPMRTPTGGRR
jgi:hypothetical protein